MSDPTENTPAPDQQDAPEQEPVSEELAVATTEPAAADDEPAVAPDESTVAPDAPVVASDEPEVTPDEPAVANEETTDATAVEETVADTTAASQEATAGETVDGTPASDAQEAAVDQNTGEQSATDAQAEDSAPTDQTPEEQTGENPPASDDNAAGVASAEEPAAEAAEAANEIGAAAREETQATKDGDPAPPNTAAAQNVSTDEIATGTEPTAEQPEVDPHAPSPDSAMYDKEATATGQTLDGERCLGDLGVGPNSTVQLEIQSADAINHPIKPFKPRQEYHMPDVITVRVPAEEGNFREVVVEIERTTRPKPYMGGYRHKVNNVEFHHASAQTQSKQRAVSNVERFCRDTQTVAQRHAVQQTTNHTSTQMTGIGCYVSNMEDKLVVPGKYVTADEFKAAQLQQVIIIQKYYRRWLAQRYVIQVRDDKQKRLEWEREEEVRKKKEKEDRIRREFERRMNPSSKEDFDLLYHALQKWRSEELERINQTLSGAERKAALCQLLEQETNLIGSIGRHKIEADTENRQKRIQGFLDKAAAPKRWKGGDGKITEMDTPYTIRAQQLRDIYNSINMKYLTQDERLDVLLTLKHTVKEHDCKLTKEIIELIDREADLLMRGIRENSLEGLRKRIATLFLQYIKTPTFNPEAARLLKVPQDPMEMRKDIYFCSGCNQYLASTEFQLATNSRSVGRCHQCTKTDNDARIRQDYSHYRYMLKALRQQEEAYSDGSKIAFLLQENDLRHLVENVWNSQSALSAWDDLYDLVLVRWDAHSEWAPWNCVLLTKEEASAHAKLDNMEEAYGKTFIHRVKHKHTLARNYFSRLPGMAEFMRTRGTSGVSSGRAPSVAGKALPVQIAKA